ncbi:coagulation factor X [Electrophorus electricus]|uniref:coagulation factor X n=1 Tax=Electrophorus electricus TaxID=8005 RepID=UPI0015D0912C|nr:coagulation factor X [Electrophorus electricus]
MFWVLETFICLLLVHYVTPEVFLQTKDANQVFTRNRRANSLFEELKKGDMERECNEERCSFEEAREIFEDNEKTDEFWNVYVDGDACISQPCLNAGICKDGIKIYTCLCPAMFQGYNCEIVIPQLCEDKNGGCEHFCNVQRNRAVCSCVKGYKLAADGKSCKSDDPFKCGHVYPKATRSIFIHHPTENVTDVHADEEHVMGTNATNLVQATTKKAASNTTVNEPDNLFGLDLDELDNPVTEKPVLPEVVGDKRIVNGDDCPPGECPWQALLVNEEKIGFCGGTILNEYFILSAAHCMNQSRSITVILGEFDTMIREGREVTHAVDQVLVHMSYVPETYHNDIALIKLVKPIKFTKYILSACLPDRDFAERVLMLQDDGMVSGFGRLYEGGPQSTILQKLTVPFIDRATCMESTKFKISNRMFCAGYDKETKDACQGDSGGPHVTKYKDTWFVTGIVSWGEGCARKGKYGVYTQVSKYIKWIEAVMEKVMPKKKASVTARKKRQVLGHTPVIWI